MQLGQGSAQFYFLSREEGTHVFYHSIYDQRFIPSVSRLSSVLLRLLGRKGVSSVKSGIVAMWICSHVDFVVAQNITHQLIILLHFWTLPIIDLLKLRRTTALRMPDLLRYKMDRENGIPYFGGPIRNT
jgi:hypothetical protein